jgi:hypothetical protein
MRGSGPHQGCREGDDKEELKGLASDTASLVSEHLEAIRNISANLKQHLTVRRAYGAHRSALASGGPHLTNAVE